MHITKVLIEEHVKQKIFEKHNVYQEEIRDGLLHDKPIVFKAKQGRYMALTNHHRYLTIIFTYERNTASIITTYPSSPWQIKLYKKKT